MIVKKIRLNGHTVAAHVLTGGQDYPRQEGYDATFSCWPSPEAWASDDPPLTTTVVRLSTREIKSLARQRDMQGVGDPATFDDEIELLAAASDLFNGCIIEPLPRHVRQARDDAQRAVKLALEIRLDAIAPAADRAEVHRVMNLQRAISADPTGEIKDNLPDAARLKELSDLGVLIATEIGRAQGALNQVRSECEAAKIDLIVASYLS